MGDCTQELDECGSVTNDCWVGCDANGNVQYFESPGVQCGPPFCTYCGDGYVDASCTSEFDSVCSDLVYNPDAYNPSTNCDCNGGQLDECGVCNGDGSTCEDFECDSAVCMKITNVNIDAGTLDIYMINDEPVGGFQFELTNIEITDASGGTASETEFLVETWGTDFGISLMYGFSFTGATIPAGEGILTQVSFSNFDGEDICFVEESGGA